MTSGSIGATLTAARRKLRLFRRKFRGFWRLSRTERLATPVFSAIFILTLASAGLTATSWLFTGLLRQRDAIEMLCVEMTEDPLGLLAKLPELLELASLSVQGAGALVAPELFVITYAFGVATVFCFLLLLVAFVLRW